MKVEAPYKIGILRALHLGDMLCAIPAIRAIRGAYLHAEIMLTGLPSQAELVGRFPHYIDRFVPFPGFEDFPEQPGDSERTKAFIESMRAEKFDLFIQMQGNGSSSNDLCKSFGAAITCGLSAQSDEPFFPLSPDTDHEVRRFFKITDALGIPSLGFELEFPILPEESCAARKIITMLGLATGNYVCIHPGARDVRRRWTSSVFSRIADQLSQTGHAVMLTGSIDEREILADVANRTYHPVINLVETFGQVSIGVLAFLICQSSLLVCNDTGVSHVASALETPSIILFSPYSDPLRWAPLNPEVNYALTADEASNVNVVIEKALEKLLIPVGA
jgi:ADP-heptose:LPS heptosyltransferase